MTLPLLPAVHGKEPGSGNTVVPEQGSPSGFGGEELKAGLPGMQLNGMPGPKKQETTISTRSVPHLLCSLLHWFSKLKC